MVTKTAIALMSGGIDSVVSVAMAREDVKILQALTFDYSQRAVSKEVEAARFFCERWNIPHQVLDMRWLGQISHSALNEQNAALPNYAAPESLLDEQAQKESAKAVWVPNRNGVFLNIAAAYADALSADYVICGFNREEAATFSDNSVAYTEALNQSFALSCQSPVEVLCPTVTLDKAEIVREGHTRGVLFEKCWPCYEGGTSWCGTCESCARAKRALASLEGSHA